MNIKKKIAEHTPEEIVSAYVLPADLTLQEREMASRELAKARVKRRNGLTGSRQLFNKIMLLKTRLECYDW
jgi:hypothetical protein